MKISPGYLAALFPAPIFELASALEAVKAKYNIQPDDMERFIKIAQATPYPVISVVEGIASGELIIEENKLIPRPLYEAETGKKPPELPKWDFPAPRRAKLYGLDGKPL